MNLTNEPFLLFPPSPFSFPFFTKQLEPCASPSPPWIHRFQWRDPVLSFAVCPRRKLEAAIRLPGEWALPILLSNSLRNFLIDPLLGRIIPLGLPNKNPNRPRNVLCAPLLAHRERPASSSIAPQPQKWKCSPDQLLLSQDHRFRLPSLL